MTQIALARATGIHQAEISRLENGKSYLGSARAQRLASVLGIASDDLL